MTKYKPLYALYKGLKEHGTDLPDSYGSFERSMTQAGNAGASNRRNFYQSLKDSNYDVPDTYEKFYESMFVPVNNTTSRARKIGETPMTEEDRKGFTLGAQDIRMNASKFASGDALRYNKLKQKKQKQQKNFGRVNVGTNKTPYAPADNVVKDEGLNTYVTSDNGDTTNLDYAQQKQAVLDVQNKLYMDALDKGEIPMASETIDKNGLYDLQENIGKDGTEVTEEGLQDQWNAKLNYAYKRRDELNKELDAIRQKEGNALLSYSATFGDTSSQISDDHRTLDAAKRKVEEEIRNLEALTGKESSSFWTTLGYVANAIPILHNIKNGINYLFGINTSRDMGKAVENSVGAAETWDFGLSGFDTYARLERIKAKVENKIPLSKAEQSFAQNMMAADKSVQLVNDNMGRAYRWTSVAGVSLPYMLDFFLTGGFSGITKVAGKFAIKKAAQWELGNLGRTVTKYIGIGLGDVASSYAMAVTEQGLKTGADVMSRHLGSLYQDKDGNYAFGTFDDNGNLLHEGGESFGKALYKGVTAAMLENYTEKMFTHWHLKRGAFKMMDYSPSLKKYADFFRHVGKSGWYGGSMNFMKKFGMGSYPEEVAEEIVNIPLNAALVGDNKFSELKDWKTWEDIVGSMAISVGSMAGMASAPHVVRGVVNQGVKAYDFAAFYVFKNRLNQADQRASEVLGEDWARIKDRIDSAPNENLGTISADLHKQVSAGTFSEEQMDAAWAYIQNLRVMRGYNLAKTMEMQAKAMTGEENMPADIRQKQLNAAYAAGQETEGENKHLAQLEYEKQKFNLAKALGVSDSELEKMTDEQISYNLGVDDNLDNVIYNYQNAKAMYDGIVDNAQSAVDTAAKVASQRVDAMTNVEDGTIRQALIKGTNGMKDYPVYIISGNVETHDDGFINYTDSDNMIIIYNESTGRKETVPVSMLADVNPNIQNAEEVKAKAILEAKQKTITDLSNVVDGKLVKGSEFTMEDAQGNIHGYKIEDVDELGNCIVSMDGTLIPEPMPLDTIQQQYDQSNAVRSAKNDQTAQEPEQTQQESQPVEDKFDYDKITNENDGKVKSVVVTDEEGKNRFPNAKAVFLIQDKGAMPKFVVMDEEGNLTKYVAKRGDKIQLSGEMTVDEYKKQRQEELQKIAAENANSSMIEGNSGTIEADRGGIEVEDNTQPLSEADADNVIAQMESSAEVVPELELTPDNWAAEFGEDGIVSTPIGDVKMGENQVAKLFEKGRSKEFGMIKPTLTNPDVIIEVPSHSADGNEERSSSYLFIKTFLGNNGEKVYYFKSVTIKKDGLEISISSHYDRAKRVKETLMKGKLLYRKNDGAQTEQNQPSTSVTTSQEDAAGSSESKDTNISANGNENNESLTFEDGTPIPVDESGETDLSQTDAAHAAEWYDNNLGEDADDWLDGEIKKAKKVLEQAKNRKLTGTKPSELVASKKEKEAAIADAQAHYDSAISIRDSLKERRIAKEENTPEGRKNLIEKARRKFARLKSAVNNDAEAVSQLYRDTIGSLLHRLYDGTGIDVTDTIPLTAEEYVASNLGAHSLNYEGTETSKGVKQETGLSRDDFAKTQLLAADGKGTTIDDLVHSLWENRPSNLESLDTQDIRNALIGVLNSGFKASEARNYIENLRIAQAENILEEQKKAADNAAFAEEHTAPAEQQTETAPESEEKIEENAADSENINEKTNENINATEQNKFPDKLKDGSKTIEVPEDATDENPLGKPLNESDLVFSPSGTVKIASSEERKVMIEKNAVRNEEVLDHTIGKKKRKALETVANMMGAKIVYLHSADQNGWYDGRSNTIYLALDSADVLGVQFIFGHEMTHDIKRRNPAAYYELKKLVFDTYGKKTFDKSVDATRKAYSDAGLSGYSRSYYEEEMVADAVGEMIRDLNLAHSLAMKMSHPLLAAIHEILQKIKLAFYGTEYSDVTKNIIRSIEQAYVKTAKGEVTNSETGEDVSFSLRQKPEPKKKGIGYKVFVLKDGKLYPPMVANPDGAATPVGVWLDADAAPIAGESKTGRPQVKQGGKGTQGGSGKLAYRPGWHLGVVPYAIQFNRKDAEGNKTLFPKNFVFAEVEYAADVDYQEEARQEGINPSGKYQHSLAGLKHLPTDGFYMYRTNPNPETDPWVITGAMKVNRILTRAEQAELVKNAGREPQQIQEGDIVTDDVVNSINQEIADAPKFSLKDIKPVGVGAFGNIYNQFRGNAKAAIEFLKKVRGGEAVGALHHKDIGDIDLVWGKEGTGHSDGYGLSKLVKYHPEVLDNLQEILNDMRVVSSSKNRVNLESETHKAGVRLTWDGERKSWLLTAFKKETSASDKRTDTAATSLEGDTALSQTEGSAAKIDNSSETTKKNGEKFSLKDEKIKSVAEKFGVNEDDVAMYANAVEKGSTAEAARARANIKRHLLQANEDKITSFKDIIKYTKPVNEALKENFGDLDAMIEERRKQVEAERNAMEAARKRAQEEEEKRQKHLEELSLIPTDELDKRYMDAIANKDEATAREMLDESARRKGYDDADSDYQGQGAWAAPSNPQYESDKERRADIDNAPDVNLEDIALGYSLQPDDYFSHPERYSQNTPHGLESVKAINTAIDAIKNGEKDVKVKVYRAVPTSVKEGKLRNGDWVTPSKKYAEMHGDHRLEGKYRIIEDEVPANQLWWDGNDANEFGFDDGKEYRYKNAKNNRKLNDLITYDNKGNVIPPSKRFNSRKSDIRFSLAGERGAAAADKADERTFRMDNLSVARKMEEEKKDAKAIKMATGWERGADGKWRYEMSDAKIKDTMDVGGGHIVKRYEDDMLWNGGKLSEVIDAPELFKAYPQLKDVRIETDAIMNDMPSNGEYNAKTNTITIHADELKYMNSILNHEIQHAIQSIEGFDRGGSPRLVRGEIKKRLAEVTKQIRQLRAEGREDEAKAIVEKNRGLYNAYQANDDYNSYKSLAGEVEARNVQERMNMTPEERRKSLAESTEDVARKDQIFLGVGDTKFSLKQTNDKFNSDLKSYVEDGVLPENSRFELGFPSEKLLSAGFPKLPISMRVSLLNKKAGMDRHPFSPTDLYNLVNAIQEPLAIFEYTKPNMRNLIVDLTKGEKHFLVGVTLDYRKGDLAVNSISGLFPKENHEWIKWIQDGKAIRIDKKDKVLSLIDSLRTNPEEAERIGLNLDSAAKIIKDFENPSISAENLSSDTKFSLRGSTSYDKQMEEWMEKNHLEKDAAPMEKPIKQDDENIFDYMNRMVEWTRNQNLWKTAPKQTGFQDALDKWKADNGLSPDAYPPVRPHRENYSTEIGYKEDLEEYNKRKELWKTAPKPKDFDLSVDLDDMNKQLRNIRRAVLNQKNYDQRTVKAVSDLVRKMLNIGWGDGLSRGKVGNLLSAAKNATGANDVKKYLDKAMGILAENYLNRLTTAYDNLVNTKGARADLSGVIKMGSLDAKGQAFMSEYKKAINMDDKSLNNYIANIEEDSAKHEDNVEMNDYRLAGIQAAIMYKQQIGGNDADISELKRQISELKNKKDATKEDKDLLKSLEKKLFENKFDRITMYENLLNNIQRMVKESKGRAKEFREEIAEHKNEILHRANLDLEGVDSTYYDTTTAKKKLVNNDLQRAVFSSTYTFEQFLKFFGKKAANGEGYLYNYFTKLNQDALDEEQLYNEMNRNALDEKTKELFGKEKFMKLVGIDGKGMKEMDIEVTDYSNKKTGKRTIHLKQGQMLYIYLVNKETDGEMKLRAMGITEEDVAAIEANLDPRVKAMGEWLQDEYLPECQRRYQATHTKYFGAPMKEVENYFPLAINNRARNVKEDVNQDSDAMSQLAGTSTGAIVTRRVNVIPLDIENADAFEVAFNHLQEMEEWSAMLPFRQDVNTLLSYTHFRNQVQNMSSVAYGSGKTLWDEFKQTAQIAAGTYKPKVNAGMMDSRIAAAMGGIAVAKISGRLWTAIKQSQSATVFLPECDFTRFVKNGVNPYGSWKWAMENIPDFRKRVENMTYGDVKLRQYLDELEKWHDWTKTISKIGMAPNILVDGITCAVGARSVYETEVNRLTKLGYPKEKAEEKAYYKAVAAYNKTQQSSGGMYLSPMQVDRTYASAALSLFKNANYAYGRMQIEACRGLARTYDFWGGKHKTALIESMTRQIKEEDGLDENTARAIAKATYNRTFRQSIGRLINFATLVPVSWALYKVLPYLLTGDDDDKKKDMIEEAVLKGFATSLSDNYVIPFASNILNAGLKVEDGKPTFDPEVFRYQNLYINPATSDLANIYSMVGNQKWYSFVNKVGMLGVQSLIGFNPETVGALYQAFAEADYDNGNTAKEWQIGVLKAISAPEESIRELYMDELGLKSGDINKIPLAELEKRYAERQINRDNLLSQIFMDAEDFNSYVDKYQQSFEKKIKDKMDKWDEYDKKKADEFFDTTSDPKLKDMIAKKRAKDANAAADEQIAKEGLNQEKKGKEPSEEAYDAVKMSIDVAEDNAISTYNKVLNKRYAALNDEYNEQTDAMKYIFMSNHPNFKAYKDLKSEYTNYGKKVKELKEKLVSADGYDAKQVILKQIRAERDKFYELQSKVR